MKTPGIDKRAQLFLECRQLSIRTCLGAGTQGTVYLCNVHYPPQSAFAQVAVKFHDRVAAYNRETQVYRRLRDLQITHVAGHRVPLLIHHDDQLLAIEMTIVSPPFCLDFGGAYLDNPPDYSPQTWADWEQEKREQFEENWPAVENILTEFRLMGIHIADVNPGNIKFASN